MLKDIKWEIVFFALAIIFLALFVLLAPQYVTAGSSGLKHYEDKDIAFDYPSDWSIEYYENPAATLFLPVPTDIDVKANIIRTNKTNNSSNENFVGFSASVSKIPTLPTGITLENAYQGEEFYILMVNNPSYKFVGREAININNLTGYKFSYQDQAYQFQEYWLTKNNQYYKIVFQIPKNNNNTNALVILNSFLVK
jgi:hypothetical protein